jgi:hypothetical protein
MSNLRSTHIAAMAMATIALMLLSGLYAGSTGNAADSSATDSRNVALDEGSLLEAEPLTTDVTYTIYDMMDVPFGSWWEDRWNGYGTDLIISEGPGQNTYLFMPEGYAGTTQGIIYAPYRYNIVADNFSGIDVHNPEFFKLMGDGPVEGAQVDLNLYFQYMYDPWYTDVRNEWLASGAYYGYMPSPLYAKYAQEGFLVMTTYDIKMNREGALEWLGLPIDDPDPVAWYSGVGTVYSDDYGDWFLDEGNVRLDIAYAYEDNYYSLYTVTRLEYDPAIDEVTLQLLHFSWGYEALMTRWLTEAGISPNHEPWYEDFSMQVSYGEESSNIVMDAACQYSLHAVRAEGTENGAAWVWEPNHIDYAVASELPSFVDPDLPSEYEPYYPLTYQSWNAGDNLFGQEVSYENTPFWFNLSEGQRLVFELPETTVAGYLGEGISYEAYEALEYGDDTAFTDIREDGMLTLGSYVSGGADLASMYDPVSRRLTIEGPVSFDNARHTEDGPLYHGAPWIEFNVGSPTTQASLEGSVLDSEDLTPVPYAIMILYYERPDGSYYYSTVSCDYSGHYSATVPAEVISVCVYGMNHAVVFATLDLTAGGSFQADFLLELDLSSPTCEVTSSSDGYVSTVQPTTVTGVASDEYIRLMYMEVLQRSESLSLEARYVVFDSKYVFLEPPVDVANVPYSVGDGTASINLEWDATTSEGGWLTHSAGSVYLPTQISGDICEMRGYYTDSEFTGAKVFLWFSELTGALTRAFFYDPYLGEVDPYTLTGTFEPAVLTYAFDEVSGSPMPTYDMWTPTGVVCQMPELTLTLDPVLPSGEYRMLMSAYDYGYNNGAAFVDVLVDNDAPTADAGLDQVVSEGDIVVLSAAGSYDNVAIESCEWTIIADDIIVLYGPEVSYAFEESGTYEVLLTVVDVAGNVGTDTVVITVTSATLEIEVRKLEGNPSRSTVTWDLSPNSDAVLNLAVKNHGLRRLTVELFALDVSTGEYTLLWRDSVALGSSGTIVYFDPSPVLPAGGIYRVTFTPLGDAGTWAMVYADLGPPPLSYDAVGFEEQATDLAPSAAEATKPN